jgi:DNA-binding beta-propeller fold protein YncE
MVGCSSCEEGAKEEYRGTNAQVGLQATGPSTPIPVASTFTIDFQATAEFLESTFAVMTMVKPAEIGGDLTAFKTESGFFALTRATDTLRWEQIPGESSIGSNEFECKTAGTWVLTFSASWYRSVDYFEKLGERSVNVSVTCALEEAGTGGQDSGSGGTGGSDAGGAGGTDGGGGTPNAQEIVVANAAEADDLLYLYKLNPATGQLEPGPTPSIFVDYPQQVLIDSKTGRLYVPRGPGGASGPAIEVVQVAGDGTATKLPAVIQGSVGFLELMQSTPPALAASVTTGVRAVTLDANGVPASEGPIHPLPPNSIVRDLVSTPDGACLYAIHGDTTGFCFGFDCARVQIFTHDAPTSTLTPVAATVPLEQPVATGVVTPDGNCLFTGESGQIEALSIAATCAVTKVGEAATTGDNWRMAVSPNGAYLFSVQGNAADTVSAFTIGANCALTAVAGSPFATGDRPFGIAVDPNGQYVLVSNASDDTLSVFAIGTGGALSQVTGSPFTAGNFPFEIGTLAIDDL